MGTETRLGGTLGERAEKSLRKAENDCRKSLLRYRGSITGIWCYVKNFKMFFFLINKNLKVLLSCCKLTPQCTKIIDECLCPQMDLVRMDCNLKKSELNCFQVLPFSFPKYTGTGHGVVPFKNSVFFFNYFEGVVTPFLR